MSYFKRKIKLLYYKLFIKRFDESSLKSKIMNDILKFLIIFFISIYFLGFILANYSYQINIKEFIMWSLPYLIYSLLLLVIINLIFKKSLEKHIFQRFNDIKSDIEEIEKENYSKRIEVTGSDELSKITYFTNALLSKFEDMLEREKKCSLVDPLTACYNRRALNINFDLIKKKTKREKKDFGIALLDLDFFKKVNDTYGHRVGDNVLIQFAKIIKEIIREEDFLYRIGGEEFVILLIDVNKTKCKHILNRLRKNVPYKLKKTVPEISHDITVSGGFVLSRHYNLKVQQILDEMLDDADKLLYKAKNKGRNKIYG